MKNSKHIKFENKDIIDKFRKKHGYKSFSEFVRDAINYFIGWLEGQNAKNN
jgi:metal-responsive CopG/Arc/MetJ family transcriptional regulator